MGASSAGAGGVVRVGPPPDARDTVVTFSVDLWNVGFERPGDHSFRILVDGSERKRLPLLVDRLAAEAGGGGLRRAPVGRRSPAAGQLTDR